MHPSGQTLWSSSFPDDFEYKATSRVLVRSIALMEWMLQGWRDNLEPSWLSWAKNLDAFAKIPADLFWQRYCCLRHIGPTRFLLAAPALQKGRRRHHHWHQWEALGWARRSFAHTGSTTHCGQTPLQAVAILSPNSCNSTSETSLTGAWRWQWRI